MACFVISVKGAAMMLALKSTSSGVLVVRKNYKSSARIFFLRLTKTYLFASKQPCYPKKAFPAT